MLYKIHVNLEIINLSRRERSNEKKEHRAIARRGPRGKTMLPTRDRGGREEKGTSADRFGMPPMDLTESLAEALSRHFVFYFRESRADWTRRVNSARCNAL